MPAQPDPALAEAAARPFLVAAALEALTAARARPDHATPVLARWFRDARRLGSRDRPLVSEMVHGVIRHEHLLLRAGHRDLEALVTGWTALVGGERFEHIEPSSPAEDYATALSVGYPVAAEWLERLGPVEAAALGAALGQRAPLTIRANRLRCSRAALAERLTEEGVESRPTRRAPDGLVLEGRVHVPTLESFRDGWFEVQDESSQLLVEAVPLDHPGTRVLDLCAGAGGKALGLAARGARVRAFDIRQDALAELERRARRAGAAISIDEPAPAPVVLVDAPCTGTGRLRRDPALRWGLRPHQLDDEQQALLEAGAELVEAGGVLIYATCSMLRSENERTLPGWDVVDERMLWPHRDGTDGFGWRIFRRQG